MRKRSLRVLFLGLSLCLLLHALFKTHDRELNSVSSEKWENLVFDYCQSLSYASFDDNVYIHAFNGTLKQLNPPASSFVKLIDTSAQNYLSNLRQKVPSLDLESAKRYACYASVAAQSLCRDDALKVKWTPGRIILKSVDAITYFPFLTIKQVVQYRSPPAENWKTNKIVLNENLLGASNVLENVPVPSVDRWRFSRDHIDTRKKRYKIAYLIMAHEYRECLVTLMDALYSPEAIYLIHIDAHSPEFKKEIIEWVDKLNVENVHVMNKSFYAQWGGSSLVMIELEGFFQLIDMAEWDYVINLSANDYPLANTSTIHHILERTPQKSYLSNWIGDHETLRRLQYAGIISESKKTIHTDFSRPRLFTLGDRFFPMKQLQWMALSRSFVELIRESQSAYDLLAYMEFSLIPDESYFSMIAAAQEFDISDMIICRMVHFVKFLPGESHPMTLHDGDEDIIFQNNIGHFFVRKLDASKEKKLKAVLDAFRNNNPFYHTGLHL